MMLMDLVPMDYHCDVLMRVLKGVSHLTMLFAFVLDDLILYNQGSSNCDAMHYCVFLYFTERKPQMNSGSAMMHVSCRTKRTHKIEGLT